MKYSEINDEGAEVGFRFDDSIVVFEDGEIHVYRGGKLRGKYGVQEFSRSSNAVFRRIKKSDDTGRGGEQNLIGKQRLQSIFCRAPEDYTGKDH